MNKFKRLLTVLFFSFSIITFSQTINEAGNTLNDGINFNKGGDISSAIQSYNECVDICNLLGVEGDELKAQAQKQLVSLHYKEGISFYISKKYEEAINKFKISAKLAKETGDTKAVKKANNIIPKVYCSEGMTLLKGKKYADANLSFNKSIKLSPSYTKAFYGNVLVSKYQKHDDNIITAAKKIIDLGKDGDKYVNKSKSVIKKYFLASGTESLKKMDYINAFKDLSLSTNYGVVEADTYYYIALSNIGLKKWDDAIVSSNKAIELEKEDKSDFYFVLGKAYEGKADNTAACTAYKNVTSGPNVKAAKYQIEIVIKCK